MKKEIMTRENVRWQEFTNRLGGKEGCNFSISKWSCSGTEDRPLATKILRSMGNIDIEATMKYFDEEGGFCDCEILLNVDK